MLPSFALSPYAARSATSPKAKKYEDALRRPQHGARAIRKLYGKSIGISCMKETVHRMVNLALFLIWSHPHVTVLHSHVTRCGALWVGHLFVLFSCGLFAVSFLFFFPFFLCPPSCLSVEHFLDCPSPPFLPRLLFPSPFSLSFGGSCL